MRKPKYIGKTEQVLCKIYSLLLPKVVPENKLPRALYMKITIIIIIWLFTICSYLKTKKSYDRWVTRRFWGFRHQISKAKYLKMSVANIGKLQEKFYCTVQNGCEIISQQKGDFAAVQNSSFNLEWSACNGCNSFISTPNNTPFEALDFWLPELQNDI